MRTKCTNLRGHARPLVCEWKENGYYCCCTFSYSTCFFEMDNPDIGLLLPGTYCCEPQQQHIIRPSFIPTMRLMHTARVGGGSFCRRRVLGMTYIDRGTSTTATETKDDTTAKKAASRCLHDNLVRNLSQMIRPAVVTASDGHSLDLQYVRCF